MNNHLSIAPPRLNVDTLPLSIIEHCPDAILVTDKKGMIIYVNKMFTELTGYTQEEVLGRTPAVLKSGVQDGEFYYSMWNKLKRDGQWSADLWNRRKDGTLFFEHQIIRAVKNEQNETTHYVSYFKDCSDELAQKRNIDYKLNYDAITALPNKRRLFEELRLRKKTNLDFSLVIVKIQDLSIINKSYSKESADLFVKIMAGRLSKLGELKNFIARVSEDDFAILTPDKISESQIDSTIQLIVSNLEAPIEIEKAYIRPSIKFGISHFPEHTDTVSQLFEHANVALQNETKSNAFNYSIFNQVQKDNESSDFLTAQEIKDALIFDNFSIHYQPQYDTSNNKIFCAEALIRWFHKGKILSPAFFLPIAEKYQLMESIDLYVLEKVFKDIATSRKNNVEMPKISINVSENLLPISQLKQLMLKHNICGSSFELELTEGLTLKDNTTLIEYLKDLKSLGITSAIDDFGTGFSSLARLKNMPFDKLKIDKQFVDNVVTNNDDRQVLKSIIDIGQVLDKTVIVEGVECREQVDILDSLNCHLVQGYYYSRPIPLEQLVDLLHMNNDSICQVLEVS